MLFIRERKKQYTSSPLHLFENFQDATPRIKNLIDVSIRGEGTTRIRIIGLGGQHTWELLRSLVLKDSSKKIDIVICLFSIPQNAALLNLNSSAMRSLKDWSEHADQCFRSLEHFKDEYEQKLSSSNINIKLVRYEHLPVVHGTLINEQHLFSGYTYWTRKGGMNGTTVKHCHYSSDSEVGKYEIEFFTNWIEQLEATASQQMGNSASNNP